MAPFKFLDDSHPDHLRLFFMRRQKVAAGRKEFVRNYMVLRRHALDEITASIEAKRTPNREKLFTLSAAPASTRPQFDAWIHALLEHYGDLIRSEGEEIRSLVRNAYGIRTNYLLIQNRLTLMEKAFNAALKPHLKGNGEHVAQTIDRIDATTLFLRRKSAEELFH